MSKTVYSNSSNYYTTSQTSWYLDFWNYRDIPKDDSSDYYIVLDGKYTDRPDLLAYDLYGNVNYWWVFSILNKDVLFDPIYDMKQGIILRIPSRTRIVNLLG